MEVVGIIILVVAVSSLAASVVYLLLRSDFPKYKSRKEATFLGVKARVWAENDALLARYDATEVAKAAHAVNTAWKVAGYPGLDKAQKVLSEVGCLLTTKDGFKGWVFYNYNVVASTQLWTKDKIFNKQIPLVVVHEGTLDRIEASTGNTMAQGQPVIHELIHATAQMVYGDADGTHKNTKLWTDIEDSAVDIFEDL